MEGTGEYVREIGGVGVVGNDEVRCRTRYEAGVCVWMGSGGGGATIASCFSGDPGRCIAPGRDRWAVTGSGEFVSTEDIITDYGIQVGLYLYVSRQRDWSMCMAHCGPRLATI